MSFRTGFSQQGSKTAWPLVTPKTPIPSRVDHVGGGESSKVRCQAIGLITHVCCGNSSLPILFKISTSLYCAVSVNCHSSIIPQTLCILTGAFTVSVKGRFQIKGSREGDAVSTSHPLCGLSPTSGMLLTHNCVETAVLLECSHLCARTRVLSMCALTSGLSRVCSGVCVFARSMRAFHVCMRVCAQRALSMYALMSGHSHV